MAKALAGESLTMTEVDAFKTCVVAFCAEQYHDNNWAMQLHYNCTRNVNTPMFQKLGPDTGFDVINTYNCAENISKLLNKLHVAGKLPKTILYSLNPAENELLDTILGAFQGTEVPGKIQHGSAWWFNDNKVGMQNQLISLANLSLLGNFIGMLTDSRSFLSYTRHAYFRRILCNLIGQWIENGEYPADMEAAGGIVKDSCFNNAARYFNL